MEGVVDAVMRDLLTRIGGIDLCVSEFIRVTDRPLPDGEFIKYCPELLLKNKGRTPAGVPVLVQLLGGVPSSLAENAARAVALGAPGIDLNFGCPAKTVNRHDGGATLLKNPHRIFDVVSAVRKAVPAEISVSAKVRLGFDHKNFHLEIARAAEEANASWLTVHARTRDEGYKPPAHWEYIGLMRENVQIPVIANGEVWSVEDYHRCRSVSGCEHVMVGRGLIAQPALARQIKAQAGENPSWRELSAWVQEFAEMSHSHRNEHYAVCRVKQWLRSIARNSAEAASVFSEIKTFEQLAPILGAIACP